MQATIAGRARFTPISARGRGSIRPGAATTPLGIAYTQIPVGPLLNYFRTTGFIFPEDYHTARIPSLIFPGPSLYFILFDVGLSIFSFPVISSISRGCPSRYLDFFHVVQGELMPWDSLLTTRGVTFRGYSSSILHLLALALSLALWLVFQRVCLLPLSFSPLCWCSSSRTRRGSR